MVCLEKIQMSHLKNCNGWGNKKFVGIHHLFPLSESYSKVWQHFTRVLFWPFSAYPATPKLEDFHPVNQVHITQVASPKFPSHPPAHPSRNTRKTPRKRQQHHHHHKNFTSESDVDPVFSLDDFTDDCEPFFESEEDDLSSGEQSKFICYDLMATHIASFYASNFWNSWTLFNVTRE